MKPMRMCRIPLATNPARASICTAVLFLAVRAAFFTESLIALSIAAHRLYHRGMDEKFTKIVSSDAPAPVRIARLWWVVSAAGALVLVVLLGAIIFYREANKPFGFEVEWMGEIVEARAPVWTIPALVFNW